jgi:hypothetical protein
VFFCSFSRQTDSLELFDEHSIRLGIPGEPFKAGYHEYIDEALLCCPSEAF